MKIGVFDSGIGGLTVLKSLTENFNNEYIYLADLKNSPYGEKTDEQLDQILINILEYFINKKVELIIIACGTLSSVALKNNIYEYKGVKVINVITSVKHCLNDKSYKNILLMATLATIRQENFKKNISNENNNIIDCPCPKFVPLLENTNATYNEKVIAVKEYVTPEIIEQIQENGAIILGCTHYNLLEKEVFEVTKNENLILSSEAVVKYVRDKNLLSISKELDIKFYTSKNSNILNNFVKCLFGDKIITLI